ncbi:GTP pyrophosphokinase rsh [Acaryochloris thomasi RCC1774]|uniref:GTP pyrophosphokinase rsh n=1 Tax=Acaryochloris thomasi RCC1774 TaxID=1764569 RepID=A0A2W1JN88_9CYAN|nr:HD domain-containing protein [Acaryochloris thomasi]PZD74788.1 GTP pyrophosphokinase rsh [Acaryochloris thomasi RCC1774]
MINEKFSEALAWAATLHHSQRRKINDTPYLAHLISVAALVLENNGTEEQAIAALLHDAVEDQGVTVTEIEQRFGATVAAYVAAVTETELTTEPQPPWQERKLRYLTQLRAAPAEAVFISLADKLHNARSLEAGLHSHGESLWEDYFKSRRQETRWFYEQLVIEYRAKGFTDHWLLEELLRSLANIFPERQLHLQAS